MPAGSELTFSPTLTVVYGGNGTGKSGYTRILSNVCFSRTQHPILPNVYEDDTPEEPAAKIVVADGTQKETEFEFDGTTEHSELRRVSVFDAAVARAHLAGPNPFDFKPAGFDVFPEMVRVYAEFRNRLDAEIKRRDSDNTLIHSFVAPKSSVSEFVAKLDAETDLAELRLLAAFGESEAVDWKRSGGKSRTCNPSQQRRRSSDCTEQSGILSGCKKKPTQEWQPSDGRQARDIPEPARSLS